MIVKVSKLSRKEVDQLLDIALKEDLIAQSTYGAGVENVSNKRSGLLNEPKSYQFLHDSRLHQAAYMLLSDAEKRELHRQMGRVLLESTPIDMIQETVSISSTI